MTLAFSEKNSCGVTYMASSAISAVHAFTTRYGGVSGGIFSSMNLGENRGDKECDVCKNYDILSSALGMPSGMAYTKQVHGNFVRRVTSADRRMPYDPVPCEADGLVTDEENLPLVIFTADCIPVLLHDPMRKAIGAVHAGWRGTASDIAGSGVRAMQDHFGCRPKDIRAAIGPGIGACCFETGPEVPQAMLTSLGSEAESFIKDLPGGKFSVDLKGINRAFLMRAGVPPENIDTCADCTMCLHEKYWSHRYTRGERGSQGAVIMLKG